MQGKMSGTNLDEPCGAIALTLNPVLNPVLERYTAIASESGDRVSIFCH